MTIAAEESYLDVENLIYHSVHKFIRKYGGDFDELVGEARVIFSELYTGLGRGYIKENPKYNFAQSLQYFIAVNLLSKRRQELFRNARCKMTAYDENIKDQPTTDDYWLTDFLDGLSDDAVTIVKIVLDSPGFVLRIEGPATDNPKEFLMEYLSSMNWSSRRIKSCFREIRRALC